MTKIHRGINLQSASQDWCGYKSIAMEQAKQEIREKSSPYAMSSRYMMQQKYKIDD